MNITLKQDHLVKGGLFVGGLIIGLYTGMVLEQKSLERQLSQGLLGAFGQMKDAHDQASQEFDQAQTKNRQSFQEMDAAFEQQKAEFEKRRNAFKKEFEEDRQRLNDRWKDQTKTPGEGR
jgi:hypothetical protein